MIRMAYFNRSLRCPSRRSKRNNLHSRCGGQPFGRPPLFRGQNPTVRGHCCWSFVIPLSCKCAKFSATEYKEGGIAMNILQIEHLQKDYGKEPNVVHALNDVTFSVEAGVFGLLGHNGA